jgi:crotonobetainyl-CoA:carnitine CoA-transferase CaiB-like acyl-CoA transferase
MAPGVRAPAPLRSEHTDEVLAECGYSAAEIQTLRDRKVVL